MTVRRHLLVLVALFGIAVTAWAETPDVDRIEANIKHRDERVQQISERLDAGDVSDATLDSQLQTLLEFQEDIDNDTKALNAALDEPSIRLGDLGPPPAEGEMPESADIAELRKNLTDQVSRLTGLAKEADLTRGGVDRLIGRVGSLQGSRFRSRTTRRSVSPFSPQLWREAAADIPPALDGLTDHVTVWWGEQRASGNPAANLTLLVAALAGAIALLMFPRWSRWRWFEATLEDNPSPSALDKRRRVAERLLSRGILAAGAGALLYGSAVEVGLVSLTGRSFALRLWLGSAMLVVVWHYAKGVFSPRHPKWRVAPVSSKASRLLRTLFVAVFGLFVVDRILAAGFELMGAGNELTLAQAVLGSSLFAVLLWFVLSPKLWHSEAPPPALDATPESGSLPAATARPSGAGDGSARAIPVRPHDLLLTAGRLLAVLILAANALAYIRLSNFVFHRGVLLAAFLILVWSVRVLAHWALSRLPAAEPAGADAHQSDEDRGKEHLGFWLNLALGLTSLALSAPVFLLIVGFDWLDMSRWFGLLSTDIRFGAVSVSFTAVLTAAVVFLLVTVGTQWMTTVVDTRLLQHTNLDAGERNSMTTLINYGGVFAGILIALPIAGVGLAKVAIVAGALSVGIGFGLQSIANNFVSGLILLFERPIKTGDWVVVSSGEGHVKHIGARATVIRTFDRASVIIPNSELVSSAVQNWFYRDRLGRVRVLVGVSYDSDPEQVREILLDCARQHPSVSSDPAITVRWKDFGESSLDFELRAFVTDYASARTVVSDLRFAIFEAFKAAGVEMPFPQRDLHILPGDLTVPGASRRYEDQGGNRNE
jgi:small-conductance mechanosensitive channel